METQSPCPNCGYCPHCGRSAQPYRVLPFYPYPGFVPVPPIWYEQPYWTTPTIWPTTVTCDGPITSGPGMLSSIAVGLLQSIQRSSHAETPSS